MVDIYILTKEGLTWNQRGMDWIRGTLLDRLGVTDKGAVEIHSGPLYNSPTWLLGELRGKEEPMVILSWDHINVIVPQYMPGFISLLEENRENGVRKTSWEAAMDYVRSFEKQPEG